MSEILICTMGLSPGVVTKVTHYLQHRERRPLSEVWVVRTSNDKIRLLFNDIVKKEFQSGGKINRLTLEDKQLHPMDTTTPHDVQAFADEFSQFLASKITPDGPLVHLCLSGGRKSMTYAATMAFVKLVAAKGRAAVQGKLALWHTQLPSDEEVGAREIEELRRQYQQARNIVDNTEIDQVNRERLLYAFRVEVLQLPFLYLSEMGVELLNDPWSRGLPEERR